MQKNNLVYTTDECIGCNKCIKSCPSLGANQAIDTNGESHIVVDGSKCISCGTCIRNCEHDARRIKDDLPELMEALANGERIVLMVAPSLFLNYPDESDYIIGYLRSLGFAGIYDVSFGANISTWAIMKYMKTTGRTGLISSACPVIVDYIEKYKPALISKLMPIKSPMGCMMTYLKSRIYSNENVKYAFLGPCIAKHDEYISYPDGGRVDYTFSYKSLFEYAVNGNSESMHSYGRGKCDEIRQPWVGRIYPIPGGLMNNLKMYIGNDVFIKQIEGPDRVYSYLDLFEKMVNNGDELPYVVDILNCAGGCSEGVASNSSIEDAEILIAKTHSTIAHIQEDMLAELPKLGNTPDEKWHTIDNIICTEEKLDYTDYMRTYNDNAAIIESDVPQEAINEIFNKMNKITEEERRINCTSCGYKNCHEMAQAIYHGYNSPQNCVHFVKDALIENNEKLESVLTAVLGNEGDLGILGVSLVSSEQIVQRIKDAMIEVENQREELNNNINAKTQMFANLTHELRTPLNAIVNMTDLLDKNNLTKKQLENINSIKMASSELMDTVNEILDFSKIEFGELSIVEDEYFLHDLFSEVITVMSFRCLEKKLQFIRRIDPSTPDLVVGDFKRTRQVFINLISNAVKYTNLGSVTVELGWNHDEENPELGFSVTDTGMGIKQEDIPYLFDSYKQVNEKESKHIQGTGLGLAISKDIVTAMGGTIEVESEYGVGTKFVVRLPAKYSKYVPVSETNMDKVEISEKKAFVIPTFRTLVVDDLLVNLHIARALLDKYQIYVDIAESGQEAIEKCREMKYNIIFMDHQMPGMSGLEAVQLIQQQKSLNNDTPIIYMSANEESTFVKDIVKDKVFDGYIEKPIVQEKLEQVLLDIADENEVLYDEVGFIPKDEDLTVAVEQNDSDMYLKLISGLERYALIHETGRTLRLAKKYRIMLQLGLPKVPMENVSVVIALCNMLQ